MTAVRDHVSSPAPDDALLTTAADHSPASTADYVDALKQCDVEARDTGWTVRDTIAVLMVLAARGLIGSDAGSSVRILFAAFTRPAPDPASLTDHLRDAVTSLTPHDRLVVLARAFGLDALRCAAALTDTPAATIRQHLSLLEQASV